jgi:nitrate/TMAO reductase-like tetraheme cytochrome c subunit
MKKLLFGISCTVALVFIFSGMASAQNKHEKFVKSYTGTESCSMCHKNSAKEMAESVHYLQLGEHRFVAKLAQGETCRYDGHVLSAAEHGFGA